MLNKINNNNFKLWHRTSIVRVKPHYIDPSIQLVIVLLTPRDWKIKIKTM